MNWKEYKDNKPPNGIEVLAFNPDWIDEDFNPSGTRIGFEGVDGFISAHWWDYQDCYMTISHTECDDSGAFSDDIKDSIDPIKWIELNSLYDLLKKEK